MEKTVSRFAEILPRSPAANTQLLLSRATILAALGALSFGSCKPKATPPPPAPPEVLVTEVQQEDVSIYDDFVGRLEPSENASIQARVQGYLISQNYEEGRVVKK